MFFTRPEALGSSGNGKAPESLPLDHEKAGPDVDDGIIELTDAVDKDKIPSGEKFARTGPVEDGPGIIDIEKKAEPDLLERISRALEDEKDLHYRTIAKIDFSLNDNERRTVDKARRWSPVKRLFGRRTDIERLAFDLVKQRIAAASAGTARELAELKKARENHEADEGQYKEMLENERITDETKEAIRVKLANARDALEGRISYKESALNRELDKLPQRIEALYLDYGKELNRYRELLKEIAADEGSFRKEIETLNGRIGKVRELKLAVSAEADPRAELEAAITANRDVAEDALAALSDRRTVLIGRIDEVQARYNEFFRLHNEIAGLGRTEKEGQWQKELEERLRGMETAGAATDETDAASGGPAAERAEKPATGPESAPAEIPLAGAADGYGGESEPPAGHEKTVDPIRPDAAPDDDPADTARGEVLDADASSALAREEEQGGTAAGTGNESGSQRETETAQKKAEEDTGQNWELFKARVSESAAGGMETAADDEVDIWEKMDTETRKIFIRTIEDVPKAERPIFKKTVETIWKDTRAYPADRYFDTLKDLHKRQLNDKHPENIWALRRALTAPDTNTYRGDRPVRLADVLTELMRFLPETVNRNSKVNYWKTLEKLSKLKF